jgi:hypothetical protein
MVALGHLTFVDTVHFADCTPRYIAATERTADLDSEARNKYSGLKELLLYMAVAGKSSPVGRDTLVDSAAGIADIAMTAAIEVGLTTGPIRGWVDQEHLEADGSQVGHKTLSHRPLAVLEVGRHEAVGNTS